MEKNDTVRQVIAWLSARSDMLSVDDIRFFHDAFTLTPDDIQPYRHFSDAKFCRNKIYSDPYCELLLLCWQSTQRSRIHNHRGSHCGVRVLQGVATETLFHQTSHGLIYPGATRELCAGHFAFSSDHDIHQISNLQSEDEDLVTLHLYSPPLRRMELFSLESAVIELADNPFSWVYEI